MFCLFFFIPKIEIELNNLSFKINVLIFFLISLYLYFFCFFFCFFLLTFFSPFIPLKQTINIWCIALSFPQPFLSFFLSANICFLFLFYGERILLSFLTKNNRKTKIDSSFPPSKENSGILPYLLVVIIERNSRLRRVLETRGDLLSLRRQWKISN